MMRSLIAFLSLFIFCEHSFAARKLYDKTVATINDEIILESDIDRFQQRFKSKAYQEMFGNLDPSHLTDRSKVLNLLIEEKLINQLVKKLELQASDQEIDGQVNAISRRNGITSAQLSERIKQLGTSMAEYKEGIRRQIERKNLVDREIRPNLEVSDDQLKYYHQRNAKPEDSERQYQIAHILIDTKKTGATASETRAKTVHKEAVEKPQSFEELAKAYSDDSSTSATGGLLGFFSLSQLSKEFKNIVPSTPPGKIAAIAKTSAGYHIVKVLSTRVPDFASLPKERKEALRNQFFMEEMEKRMASWLERKRNEAFIRVTPAKGTPNADAPKSAN